MPQEPADLSGKNAVDEGLEAYRRGDLNAAVAAWDEALKVAPDDARLRALVDYVRQQILGAPPVEFETDFPADDDRTNPELSHETLERVLRAERDAADATEQEQDRPRRKTLITNISELLAPATRREWPPDEDTQEVPPAADEEAERKP